MSVNKEWKHDQKQNNKLQAITANKVLIVEENVFSNMALMTQFQTLGFACDQAYSSREALHLIEARLDGNGTEPFYHLIIFDGHLSTLFEKLDLMKNKSDKATPQHKSPFICVLVNFQV